MRRALPLLLLWLPLVASQGAEDRCADRCRELGECIPQQGDRCAAVFDESCEASEACARFGRCAVDGSVCAATTVAGCEASEMCRERGECTPLDGHCEAVSDVACQQSQGCKDHARCTLGDGECVVGSAADCARSALCRNDGECGARNGSCVPTTDDHCAQSAACADEGRCILGDDACVVPDASGADTGTSDPEASDPNLPIQLDGPLRRKGVRKVLRAARERAQRCGPLTAEVELTATIEPSGKIVDVAVFGVPRKQERCIARALRKHRLPERKRPTDLTWRLHRAD